MKALNTFANKKVLVLGLAKSGYAAAKLMKELGADVTVNDRGDLSQNEHAKDLAKLGVRIVGGGHPLELIDHTTALMIKNPGIPYSNPMIKRAETLGIPVVTEVEIAGRLADAPFIGITGSNGKTTTTMLIGEMMKGSSYEPIVAGNIGTALTSVVQKANEKNVIVAELSSFQLQGTIDFHPHVAVVLNIFDHHLDYHGTVENYAKAKAQITANQTADDALVYNADSKRVVQFIAEKTKAKKVPFSLKQKVANGAYVSEETIYFKDQAIMKVEEMGLPGEHNLMNALAALAVAGVYGVSVQHMADVLRSFKGVRHRLEYVGVVQGRTVYNDSKATNSIATSQALHAFPKKEIVLLAGGLDRGNSFDVLVPDLVKAPIKAVLLFGETQQKLKDACLKARIPVIKEVENVEAAVPEAFALSQPGDVILLSPACASWDQYKSFEQRGDIFIAEVNKFR
ncbi:UDP-N-acetylmuramoyl-L-alanine--D-glutamate ligase [Sporolactobacillus inulinus]|uniref:UDP-N-acetylmuramoylalanine--D-glutamate ligase n=1 Tax=Sporolactobacillus inulinus CASD TaxID=1069536 RepID=A0A0U1QMD5_9BACL|nr:UDP-N-acetylmuramoyl-L-alanine--D-glutamate ligase [Sporolactobacillus inulinus]KLI01776.1 UDP-N-acetylmuramoyl-L-alanyl-D-glutamate synthetase [Sporolactobacillus inulinus CASD]GEB76439.1 UDP-N-acetylmuramoylalanine--D-glutamate ligase [Sporolactobacillus inulinus]